jgi:hypothetical protein
MFARIEILVMKTQSIWSRVCVLSTLAAAVAMVGLAPAVPPPNPSEAAGSDETQSPPASRPAGVKKWLKFWKADKPAADPAAVPSQKPDAANEVKPQPSPRPGKTKPAEKVGPPKPAAQPEKPGAHDAAIADQPDPAKKPERSSNAEKKPSAFSRLFGKLAPPLEPPARQQAKPVRVVRAAPPVVVPTTTQLGPDQWVVTKDESPFYSFGPNQATPPDAYLTTGTVVTLVNKTWGWAEIKLADGRTGIMARDALRLATIYDLPPPSRAPSLLANTTPRTIPIPPSSTLPPAPLPELPAIEIGPKPTAEELSTSLLPPFSE